MGKYSDLFHNIEIYRTRDELKVYIEKLYSEIRSDKNLIEDLQLRKERFKELREEIIPLSRYSFSKYARLGSFYRVVLGNQQYDAIELFEGVEYFIEFTEYHDGNSLNKRMVSMHKNGGISAAIGVDYHKTKDMFFKGFEENVKKKSEIHYLNTRIVFIISDEVYGLIIRDETLDDYNAQLIEIIKDNNFGNNEVYLMKPSNKLIYDGEDILIKVK